MNWAYGVTTVPSRKATLLPRTLKSLKAAGFPCPRLFVDGCYKPQDYDAFGLEVTVRNPAILTAGNWVLSLNELLYRDPDAKRYAIFQDDFVTYRNLRAYLEQCPYPKRAYWNLFTFPVNQALANGHLGWYESNQLGKGAVALVFNNEAVRALLGTEHLANRPCQAKQDRRHKSIDGGIVTAFASVGWHELVHNPSLVEHCGVNSTTNIGSKWNIPTTFRGEDFDATELIREQANA